MTAGLDACALEHTTVCPDRAEAIAMAVQTARPGDIILVAGKGHETTQTIGTTSYHFDDREQVAAAFAKQAK